MTAKYHINPRFRAYGKARLDVTLRARDEQEWQQMWRQPLNSFPFKFGTGWKFCFEYRVDDFAAEVGFYIDVLGFNVNAFSPHYAQFSSPGGELCISIVQAAEGEDSTPADTIRLQLQIRDVEKTSRELETRNVVYEKSLGIEHDAESTLAGFFRTPHGVRYDLWEQSSGSTSLIDDEDEDYDYDDYEDEDEYDDPVDEDRIDDDPIDGGQNLNLAEMDEDEADRVLNELLGLSDDSQSDREQDALNQTDLDDMDDDEDDYTDDAEESDNDDYIDDLSVDAERQASFISKGSTFSIHQNTNWNASDRPIQRGANISQLPSKQSNSRSVNWPRDNDSRGLEPTYGDIEEDLGYESDLD